MRIPLALKTIRFYVATSSTEAYSSWHSLYEAEQSYLRLSINERKNVIAIIEVNGTNVIYHPVQKDV